MKNSFCLSGLAVALLGLGVVHGEGPAYTPGTWQQAPANPPSGLFSPSDGPNLPGTLPRTDTGGEDTQPLFAMNQPTAQPQQPAPMSNSAGISSWLAYPRPCGCCGPVGGNGPISAELYVRTGASVPIGGGVYGNVLTTGWDINGGVRTLFFNPQMTAAWTADLNISNDSYQTSHGQQFNLINFLSTVQVPSPTGGTTSQQQILPSKLVTPRSLNDTYLNLSFGRECYLYGTASCSNEFKWRVGADFGGDWGSSRLELLEITHKTGVIEGFFFALHSDVEYPICGCCVGYAGGRIEYGYTLSNILQRQNDTLLQTFNFLVTFGLRY